MNHFELYGLPVSFQIDQIQVKDRFAGFRRAYKEEEGVPEAEREARWMEAQKGYKILMDEEETMRYVLKIRNQLDEDYQPDPEFRLEVMDLDEELMELELDEKQELLMDVEQKATHLMVKIYDDVAEIIQAYREDTGTEEELLQVKEFYYRKKYLQRILDRIKVIRNIASPQ